MQARVIERAQTRMLPLANRANDLGPAATICCNACRTCMTTNVVGAGIAVTGALALGARRFARRFFRR